MMALIFPLFLTPFLGSFFNVLIDRIYRGEQFVKGHSYCESCKHELATKDLIPIFSFLFLKGKCRYCGAKIPFMLPIVEITTIVTLSGIYIWFINSSDPSSIFFLIFALTLASILILIFFTDLKYQVIPDVYLIALALAWLVPFVLVQIDLIDLNIYEQILFSPTLSRFAGAAWLFAFFGIIHLVFKGKAIGEGDIYLSALLGFYIGLEKSFVMWFFAFVTGAVIGVILIAFKKKHMKSAIPFGPFLIAGFAFAIIYGADIWNWYLSFLG